jgi:hypothetical protein
VYEINPSALSPLNSRISWQWSDYFNTSLVKGNIAHTCRKFDRLQEWAKQRMIANVYDPTVHIEDDIVIPVFHNEIP